MYCVQFYCVGRIHDFPYSHSLVRVTTVEHVPIRVRSTHDGFVFLVIEHILSCFHMTIYVRSLHDEGRVVYDLSRL